MCVSPVLIPNPNYHNPCELIQNTTDTELKFLRVPCGVCNECLMKRQSDIVQRCKCLALDHYIFFCTLTYNRESLPVIKTSTGVSVKYADYKDAQNMFKRIRKYDQFGRPFKYFFVTERGKKGRPHFHGLIFIPKSPSDDSLITASLESTISKVLFREWRRNYGSRRAPVWKPLFTYKSKFVAGKFYRNFDCHYVVPHSTDHGSDDVAFYVSKYVLKPSEYEKKLQQALRLNLEESEYMDIWRIVRSRCFSSKGFGAYTDLEKDYITDCIHRSSDDSNGFQYINQDGTKCGLARYYRKFVDADSAIRSVAARGGPVSLHDRTQFDLDESLCRSQKIISEVSKRDIIDFIPDD